MTNTIISALLQLLAFSLIPFLVYLIRYKKAKGFFSYIGLKPSNRKANFLALLLMLFIALPILFISLWNEDFIATLTDPKSVTGNIRNMGLSFNSIIILLITAIIKTGLAEEIFFRGFVAKRLIALTNFKTGNIIQAIIFGLIHTLVFLSITDNPLFLFIIFLFPASSAYIKVILNEKLAKGSIIPSWIAHASGNILAYSLVAFVL